MWQGGDSLKCRPALRVGRETSCASVLCRTQRWLHSAHQALEGWGGSGDPLSPSRV